MASIPSDSLRVGSGTLESAAIRTGDSVNCRICARPTHKVFTLHSHRHDVDVPVFRCNPCDAYFSDGGPVDYDDTDLTGYYLTHAEPIRQRYERIFGKVESLMKPARFFDIGAGMGFSLEVAQRRGWTSAGLEPNKRLAEHARSRGLAIDNAYLDDSLQGQYDFVLIDNVLEHVPDPTSFLRHASRLLSLSGLMVIAIPPIDWLRKGLARIPYVRDSVAAPQLNVFGEVDEHLNMFGRRAMASLLQRVGLRLQPDRYHHSPVYDNRWIRTAGLDDGYYFVSAS